MRSAELYAPAGFTRHVVEPDDGAYWPAGHGVQLPLLSMYVPALHGTQLEKSALLNQPAGQGVHDVEPALEDVPTAHELQDADVGESRYCPAAHCRHAVLSLLLREPVGHSVHSVALATDINPTGHGAQVNPAATSRKEPAAQGEQAVAFSTAIMPTGHGVQAAAETVSLYAPAGQGEHTDAGNVGLPCAAVSRAATYCPGRHTVAAGEIGVAASPMRAGRRAGQYIGRPVTSSRAEPQRTRQVCPGTPVLPHVCSSVDGIWPTKMLDEMEMAP